MKNLMFFVLTVVFALNAKITFFLLLAGISIIISAQPRKGTWEINGSGSWGKVYNQGDLQFKTYELVAGMKYFVFKHLSAGISISAEGYQDRAEGFKVWLGSGFLVPNLDVFIINHKIYGISLKSAVDINIWGDYLDNTISSFTIGPKFSLNITPNLNTFLWVAYRRAEDFDTNYNTVASIPSDNFDIRWGFSYYLHRKQEKNKE